MYTTYGLTDLHGLGLRCDRCDNTLDVSEWKGIHVVFSISRKWKEGFFCVRCITSKTSKRCIPIKELDDYVAKIRVVN